MAGGTKSVGRVSIRVLPDATRFREDLKKTLTRLEKMSQLKIAVDADLRPAERSIKRFVDHWNGQTVTMNADVDAGVAAARLTALTRPRSVAISAVMVPGSLAKVGTALAALSGGRLVGDSIGNVAKSLGNLDRSLPKIAALSTSIASLLAVVLSAGGGLATLAASLSSILAIAALAPALIGGAGVSIAVLAVALSQMGDRLGDVVERWKGLGDVIGNGFWEQAAQPLRELSDSIFPGIRDGLAGTASALGSWTASLAAGFQTALSGAALEQMFGRLNESIGIAAGGTGAFASALVGLGVVGSDYLPRLAQWIADLTTRFDEFVTRAAADGSLKGWIDQGITAAQQLGSVLFSAGSIISSIADAAQAAGGGGLATLASSFAGIAEVMASSGVQEALTTLFTGGAAGAAGLATALAPLGQLIGALAPALADILSSVGTGLGGFLGSVASALETPAFQTGLTAFFDGILAGIAALEPALPALAAALGSVGTFAGLLGSELGGVLASAITALAPVVTILLEALSPLIPVLGDALIEAMTALAPVIADIATTLLPPLVAAFAELLPTLVPLIEEILPVLTALLPPIGELFTALAPLLVPFVEVLTLVAQIIAAVLVPAIELVTPLVTLMVGAMTLAASFMSGILQTALLLISGLLSGDLSGALTSIGALWGTIWQAVIDVQARVAKAIGDFVAGVLENFGVTEQTAREVGDAITGFFEGLAEGVQGFVEDSVRNIKSFISDVIGVVNSGIGLINGALSGLSAIGLDISIPNIPELALGATIQPTEGGTLVRVAEKGKAESVVDTGLLNRQLALSNSRMAAQQQAPAGDRPVYMDGGALFGVIRETAQGEARLIVNDALEWRDQNAQRGNW